MSKDIPQAERIGDVAKFLDANCNILIVDGNGKPLDIENMTYHLGGGGFVVQVKQKRQVKQLRPLDRYVVQYGQWKGDKGYVVVSSNAPLNKTRKVWYTSDNKSECFEKANEMNATEEAS